MLQTSRRRFLAANVAGARAITEPDGGISAARNRALREAARPVVCFVDDDVRVQPGWLDALRRAWSESAEDVACIGGPLLPEWQAPRPPWLADYLLYVVSVLDLGGERRRLDQAPRVGYVWGGNFSVRVEPALALGGFDPARGVRPADPLDRGEEEDLQRRYARHGMHGQRIESPRLIDLQPDRVGAGEVDDDTARFGGQLTAGRGGRGHQAMDVSPSLP